MELDLQPEQRRRYFDHLRTRTTAERGAILVGLCECVRAMAEAGIRSRHPGASPEELRVRLAVRLYGREVAARYFAELPEDAR